jgi:thioredoxin 2
MRFGILSVLSACIALPVGCANSGGTVTDIESPSQFQAVTAQADRPVMVKFYKHGCPACVMIAGMYKDLAAAYSPEVEFLEVERGASGNLRSRYGIGAYPTVLLLIDGQEQARWVNEHDRSAYDEAIRAALKKTSGR